MPSTEKTPNLGLNSWLADDKPKRVDFVEDNNIIDEKLGGHLSDSSAHLSESDREKLSSPVYKTSYSGTGTATKNITLPCQPSWAVVYKRYSGFCNYDTDISAEKINGAFFSSDIADDDCGGIKNSVLTVKQSTSAQDDVFYNLNEQYGQYVVLAFR